MWCSQNAIVNVDCFNPCPTWKTTCNCVGVHAGSCKLAFYSSSLSCPCPGPSLVFVLIPFHTVWDTTYLQLFSNLRALRLIPLTWYHIVWDIIPHKVSYTYLQVFWNTRLMCNRLWRHIYKLPLGSTCTATAKFTLEPTF